MRNVASGLARSCDSVQMCDGLVWWFPSARPATHVRVFLGSLTGWGLERAHRPRLFGRSSTVRLALLLGVGFASFPVFRWWFRASQPAAEVGFSR